jgi:hypothetical protein
MELMSAEEQSERLAALEDLAEAWAGWWAQAGARGYVGAVLPPLARTEAVLAHRRGLVRETWRRRAARRERPAGNLRLPL